MANSLDRQGILDNLTSIETTAKLLVNALVKKKSDAELYITGIHREELLTQTTAFLAEAKQLILNLSHTYNLPTDDYLEKKPVETKVKSVIALTASEKPQTNGDHRARHKTSPPKKTCTRSSATLEDVIQQRLTPRYFFPNFPSLRERFQTNLVSLALSVRQLTSSTDLLMKTYARVFNHDERICCNYHGTRGKLPFPRHKRMLFDLLVKLILDDRQKSLDEREREKIYEQCEKRFATDTPALDFPGMNIDQLKADTSSPDGERRFVCRLFRLVLPEDDIAKIVARKHDSLPPWNDNDVCIYYAQAVHLLWIKQQWLKRYPAASDDEAHRWAQCINWAVDSFLETEQVRPSKRKTMSGSTDHKRTRSSLTLSEKVQQVDRTKFGVFEYAGELLRLISTEGPNALPTLEQLQLVESSVTRYYWTPDQQQTWSRILDTISDMFEKEAKDDQFRQRYAHSLLAANEANRAEIDRLLQITE